MARGRVLNFDDRVRNMALRFADDVARAVRSGMAEEVARQVTSVIRNATKGSPPRVHLGAGTGDRRIGRRPVPVKCPVPSCAKEGIRAKRNFCADHAESLSETEKRKLRDAQALKRATAPRKPRRR